ncbi:hypothetical protein BC834DRAFT_847428 [Gloeopeniophorella convolvens]|nr:hypothetical protein BC834DRAFT_847428 [Gloeopeniophorella convolvens]
MGHSPPRVPHASPTNYASFPGTPYHVYPNINDEYRLPDCDPDSSGLHQGWVMAQNEAMQHAPPPSDSVSYRSVGGSPVSMAPPTPADTVYCTCAYPGGGTCYSNHNLFSTEDHRGFAFDPHPYGNNHPLFTEDYRHGAAVSPYTSGLSAPYQASYAHAAFQLHGGLEATMLPMASYNTGIIPSGDLGLTPTRDREESGHRPMQHNVGDMCVSTYDELNFRQSIGATFHMSGIYPSSQLDRSFENQCDALGGSLRHYAPAPVTTALLAEAVVEPLGSPPCDRLPETERAELAQAKHQASPTLTPVQQPLTCDPEELQLHPYREADPQGHEHEVSRDKRGGDGGRGSSPSRHGRHGNRRQSGKIALLACYVCRSLKIACKQKAAGDKDQTCIKCAKRGISCEYPPISLRGRHSRIGHISNSKPHSEGSPPPCAPKPPHFRVQMARGWPLRSRRRTAAQARAAPFSSISSRD